MAEGRAAVEIFTDAKELQRAVGIGDGDRLHARHAHKCPHMHAVEARRQGERCHPLAFVESIIIDDFHARTQVQGGHGRVASEGLSTDGGHTVGNGDGKQTGVVVERSLANAGNVAAKLHLLQSLASIELVGA